jgi:hypothetical protein
MLGTIAAIGGIAGAASSYFGGKSADRAAKRAARQQIAIGKANAAIIGEETAESERRFDIDTAKTLSTGKAIAAASGFGSGGSSGLRGNGNSMDNYMTNMASEMRLERDWMGKSGRSRQKAVKLGAQYSSDALRSQGKAAKYNGIGGMFNGLTQAAGYMI